MTTTMPPVASLPVTRPSGRPLDPPEELVALRERAPLARLHYPDGHLGWLATGYDVVRAVLGDSRFSSRQELIHFPIPRVGITEEFLKLPPAPLGDMTGVDGPEHRRYRSPFTAYFTAGRMRSLGARVTQISTELLDEMIDADRPVDLVEAYAHPLPTRVICELLGVPYADRELFGTHTRTLIDHNSTGEQVEAAFAAIHDYLRTLIAAKRTTPTDDILGAVLANPETDFTDDELAVLGGTLLGAGIDTTASMITLSTYALLTHPDQLTALRAEPEALAAPAVEELLRWLTIGHTGMRVALEDIELDGQHIAAGETVTLAVQVANRDPDRFPDPDTLDLRRNATGQLAFGHGPHHCLGHQLGRLELREALPALLTRFPNLRLAVAPDQVPLEPDANVYGARQLPVTW